MSALKKLTEMSSYCQARQTEGLDHKVVEKFLHSDARLAQAIQRAYDVYLDLRHDPQSDELLKSSEKEQIKELQSDILNFYPHEGITPYVPLAGQGPWVVTSCGAVIYDAGGYGMLGMGHAPKELLEIMAKPYAMTNVMTANFSQKKMTHTLKKEIGQRRKKMGSEEIYHKFMFLNSGSEAVTLAARISDAHAKTTTNKGQEHHGKKVKFLSLVGSFHGRTEVPSQLSHSCLAKYKEFLFSYAERDNLLTVEANNLNMLQGVFDKANKDGVYIEAMFIEPVMGEGNPGQSMTPTFYKLARKLTHEHQSLLIVDSIQAGFRAYGYLSVVDYPGFETLPPPDMETFSKAINAGQYPLSILGLSKHLCEFFKVGLYGNTMTSAPRGLEIGIKILESMTSNIRENICERGKEVVIQLKKLQEEFPALVTYAQGTGLLFALGIEKERLKVVGTDGLEQYLRKIGLGVIHGGENALRFTPIFNINAEELKLMVDVIRQGLKHFS